MVDSAELEALRGRVAGLVEEISAIEKEYRDGRSASGEPVDLLEMSRRRAEKTRELAAVREKLEQLSGSSS